MNPILAAGIGAIVVGLILTTIVCLAEAAYSSEFEHDTRSRRFKKAIHEPIIIPERLCLPIGVMITLHQTFHMNIWLTLFLTPTAIIAWASVSEHMLTKAKERVLWSKGVTNR